MSALCPGYVAADKAWRGQKSERRVAYEAMLASRDAANRRAEILLSLKALEESNTRHGERSLKVA